MRDTSHRKKRRRNNRLKYKNKSKQQENVRQQNESNMEEKNCTNKFIYWIHKIPDEWNTGVIKYRCIKKTR